MPILLEVAPFRPMLVSWVHNSVRLARHPMPCSIPTICLRTHTFSSYHRNIHCISGQSCWNASDRVGRSHRSWYVYFLVGAWLCLHSILTVELIQVTLALNSNALSGPLPTELGSLLNLQHLDLGENLLLDTIPTELGNLLELRKFLHSHHVPNTMSSTSHIPLVCDRNFGFGNQCPARCHSDGSSRLAEPPNCSIERKPVDRNRADGAFQFR